MKTGIFNKIGLMVILPYDFTSILWFDLVLPYQNN